MTIYFFTNGTIWWDAKPFSANAEMSTQELFLSVTENFIELQNDRSLKLKFSDVPLDELWISIEEEYKRISKVAI